MIPMHVNPFEQTAKLNVLSSGTQYRICVIGLGSRLSPAMTMYYTTNMVNDATTINATHQHYYNEKIIAQFPGSDVDQFNEIGDGEDDGAFTNANENKTEAIFWEFRNGLMKSKLDTPISRCTEVRTLPAEPVQITDQNRLTDRGLLHSLLTRRLGLIVGCCLGIFVFIVIVTVLGWLKLKKRRIDNAKRREQQLNQVQQLNYQHRNHAHLNQTQLLPPPPDYNNTSYRQFTTLPYDDMNFDAHDTSCAQHVTHQPAVPPNCISGTVIGTTTIAC